MVIATLALLGALTGSAPARCADPLSDATIAALATSPQRVVDTRALLSQRNFGPQDVDNENDAPFSISPDGRNVALLLRRAEPDGNAFCQSLVVIDIASGKARVIDRGGTMLRVTAAFGGYFAGYPSGFPRIITPAWSPDGRTIAYLKVVDGPAQVWSVPVAGGAARALTHEAQEVTAVAWSRSSDTVLFQTDRGLTSAQAAIEAEGRSGWHYDERVSPTNRARPFPAPSDPATLDHALELASSNIRSATSAERETLADAASANRSRVELPGGTVATLVSRSTDPGAWVAKHLLELKVGPRRYRCTAKPCASNRAFWLSADATSVLILARSGWGNGEETFYRWTPRTGRTEQLSSTRDALMGCRPSGTQLLCAREASTEPRRLALIDPVTGAVRPLFNPNPDYDVLRAGKTERIFVTSANGARTFADVMLPPDFVVGRRYPMVVVQYQSRGFLSGGTNNEFPIPPLASAGMIVLSFQRPRDVLDDAVPAPRSFSEAMKLDFDGWADRRNVQSALLAAVDQVIARGIVDERKIGITGLSDGLATAAFALLNSNRFSVAALAACCEEPIEANILTGPRFARDIQAAGYPPLTKPDDDYWRDYSIAQNAARIRVPILIQAADTEYLLSLPTVTALREAGKPVDLYVFPDEHHSKWQPAHRLAVWERTLRWFETWFDLPPMTGQQPAPADEAARWRQWRAQPRASSSVVSTDPSLGIDQRQQP